MGQAGQELSIEVYKLERIIGEAVPNTHTRESCPPCPKDILKPRKQAIYKWTIGTR